jgi:hypothetical protein
MIKPREAGQSYRPVVKILRVKKEIPTVLMVSGQEYILRHQDQYKGPRKGEKK